MTPVVFDCNVLISAIGWGGNSRRVLAFVAQQRAQAVVSNGIWSEYETRIPQVLRQHGLVADAGPTLNWLLEVARFVEPAPLGKQRSRDVKGDCYLAAALAAGAVVVTNDRDLLDLKKPFGVSILTPIEFIKRVRAENLP